MLKSFAKTTFFAVALGLPLCGPASADFMEALKVSPRNSTFGPGAPVFEVESDGESWTSIKPGKHQLEVSIDIAAGSGWRITNAYIGVPSADFGGTSSQSDAIVRLGGGEDVKSLGGVKVYEFQTDALGLHQQEIIAACNAGNHPPTQEHPASSEIQVGIKAYFMTRKDARFQESGDDEGRSQTAYAHAPVNIRCLAAPSHAETPPKPVSVDIRVAEKGNTCPKDAEVTAYIDYEKPMTGRFKVVHNGAPGETIEIKAREVSLAGKTWYRIERLERYELDPGKHDFQIKVIGGGESPTRSLDVDCPPFKVTSAWLKYEVENKDTCPKKVVEEATFHANGPGEAPYRIKTQGGLVVTQGTAHIAREGDSYVARRTRTLSMGAFDQMMQLELLNDPSAGDQKPLKVECVEALSGELTLQSRGTNSCKGEALVAIHTDGAGELPYELECGLGKSWQRKVTAMANKIGVDKVQFDVTNNEQVTCALRTRIGGKLKPLDGASMTFTCHKPIDTGADDLAPETPPEEPPPVGDTLSGDFSFVDTGGTRCPRQGKALINFKTSKPDNVHYSLDCTNGHFSGVAQTVPSPQGGFIAPALVSFGIGETTSAKCALKTVAPGKPKVHTLKGHTFQCVRTTGVDGSDDLAPDTRPDPQKPDKPGKIVIDPPRDTNEPKIACAGGTVKGGACVCERTMKPVKAGKNAWRCVKVVVDPQPDKPTVSQPKISCAGGTVRNGACACDPGEKPVKAGKNAWRCVKVVVIDPPRNKDSGNRSDARVKGDKKSVKIGKTKAGFSNRSSSSMPR